MTGKKTAVFGLYRTRTRAEQAVDRLLAAGFSNDDISVLLPDNEGSKDFWPREDTKAPEGTTTGVAAGGGDRWKLLACLPAIGALAIPGFWFRLLRPVRSWARRRPQESAARSGVWLAHFVGMGNPGSTKRSDRRRIRGGREFSFPVHCDTSK